MYTSYVQIQNMIEHSFLFQKLIIIKIVYRLDLLATMSETDVESLLKGNLCGVVESGVDIAILVDGLRLAEKAVKADHNLHYHEATSLYRECAVKIEKSILSATSPYKSDYWIFNKIT